MGKTDERNEWLIKIGNRIQQSRIKANLTQDQVAECVGISQKHLSRIEKGYHNPHFDIIISLSKILNVSIDSFAQDIESENIDGFLQLIKEDIKNLSPKQKEMLRDNISTIKKYYF